MISDEARRYLPPNTPDWILAIIDAAPHGGWFVPFKITEGHPLIDGWRCMYCNDPFDAGEGKAFVQPFHGTDSKTGESFSRWVATHHGCMAEALGLDKLLEMTPIERFYRGVGLDSKGRTFEIHLAMSNDEWEDCHQHIQWAFPLPEPSRVQPSSPVLTEADLEVFRTDPEVRANVERAFNRWMDFMEGTTQWLRPRDHNHLRITRIIRFLTLIGNRDDADQVFHTARGMMKKAGALTDQTEMYWREARKENPSWLK